MGIVPYWAELQNERGVACLCSTRRSHPSYSAGVEPMKMVALSCRREELSQAGVTQGKRGYSGIALAAIAATKAAYGMMRLF